MDNKKQNNAKNAKLIGLATNKAPKKENKTKDDDINKLINHLPKSDEEMEQKAKELASSVIKNIPELEGVIDMKDNEIVMDNEVDSSYIKDEKMGNDWLSEQVAILTEENEMLKNRLMMVNDDGISTTERENIKHLFIEFQNHLQF